MFLAKNGPSGLARREGRGNVFGASLRRFLLIGTVTVSHKRHYWVAVMHSSTAG